MNYLNKLVFYQNITPLHVGCGQDVGIVDLPVIRERSTGYPYIPGSGIRGSLRAALTEKATDKELIKRLFGPEQSENPDEPYAGCLSINDARLLCMPVRSDKNVFMWVTCEFAIRRFLRDISAFGVNVSLIYDEQSLPAGYSQIGANQYIGAFSGNIYLEEFKFSLFGDDPGFKEFMDDIGKLAGIESLGERCVLIENTSFYHFANHATMIVQHNTLNSAKTVKDGALFAEESVPPDALFYSFTGATRERHKKSEWIEPEKTMDALTDLIFANQTKPNAYLHLGGGESTGMGLTKLAFVGLG